MSEPAYEDIKTGDEASLTRAITEVRIANYAGLTGTGTHADAEHTAQSTSGERIAHGLLVAGPISAVLDDKKIIKLRTTASNQRGEMVIDGTAVVKKVGL
jgi:3-hydroxybutyryl-CoA dehydratase